MTPHANSRHIAYFSMEIALDPSMHTYSGGLGILSGDTLRSAADMEVEMVAVTLIHHKGYFRQHLDQAGQQTEEADTWDPRERLTDTGAIAHIPIEERIVAVRIWRFEVHGITGHRIPVYLLDTDVPANSDADRTLTDTLYGGDLKYRLLQEAVLGLGGLAALAVLGHRTLEVFHMNEGHSALLTLGLLEYQLGSEGTWPSEDDIHAVREKCVFTTHTPVPAGHDRFSRALADEVLGAGRTKLLEAADAYHDGQLNMTYLALRFSRYVNGVAMKHGEISREMFPTYKVRAITNGVHAATWISEPFRALFDKLIPEWRRDNLYLRYVIGISPAQIEAAHLEAKRRMIRDVQSRSGVLLDEKVFTLGFARRATKYKRAGMLFTDLDRLRHIAKSVGPIQVVYAGKAHPADMDGKAGIREVFEAAAALAGEIPVVFLNNYEMSLAATLTSGVDVWLNTPLRPQEASGTSGMKAALNGVPSLSILDGWWIEGCLEGVTGWAIGSEKWAVDDAKDEIESLYRQLEDVVLPMYYKQPDRFAQVRQSAIALNGSFFNTQRMVAQYLVDAYATRSSDERT